MRYSIYFSDSDNIRQDAEPDFVGTETIFAACRSLPSDWAASTGIVCRDDSRGVADADSLVHDISVERSNLSLNIKTTATAAIIQPDHSTYCGART